MSSLIEHVERVKSVDIRRVFHNPVLLFAGSRYVGYGLQFIRGMLVARFLGPYLFGVWGFLMLALRYLSYTSLGLQYAVNVELATSVDSANTDNEQEETIRVALTGTAIVAALLILSGVLIQLTGLSLFAKYSFNQYVAALASLAGLTHLREVLKNVHRVYGNLARIAAGELLTATLPLLAALVFREQTLVFALLGALTLSEMVSIAILIVNAPFRASFSWLPKHVRHLLSIGIPLLVYNVSFYLIMIAGRTVISMFYPVQAMGYYSLANSITTATMLGLKAGAWVVYPDILSRTSQEVADETVAQTVQKVNDLYGTSVILVIFAMILILPLMFLFLPDYKPVEETLGLLLMSQAVMSLSFGYNCVAVARKQQMRVAKISWIAVAVVVLFSLLAAFLELHYVWVAGSILAGSFVFTALQVRLGSQTLRQSKDSRSWQDVLPSGRLAAISVLVLSILLGYTTIGGVIGLIVFIVANKEDIITLWHFIWQSVLGTRSENPLPT